MGKVRSSSQNSIVEGSPVVHPGIPGTIVAIETPNARIAAIVRSAESQKAAKAGAKEFHLQDEFSTYIAISRKGFQPLPASPPLIKSGRSRALGARLVCFVSPRPRLSALSPYSCQNGSVSQSSAASQRAAPRLTQAFPGPVKPLRQPTPATPPLSAGPRAKRPRRPEVRPL